jgi:acyl-CoA dehydrogenase
MTTTQQIDPYTEANAAIEDVISGLCGFVDQAVVPIQTGLGELFTDPRRYFNEKGVEAEEITEARRQVRKLSAAAGYYTMFVPEELGGGGLGNECYFRCIEALGRRYGPGEPSDPLSSDVIANWFMGPGPIWLHASDELRAAVYPSVADGSIHGSFGLSEPDAGSDVWNIRTTAKRDGGDWIINGAKQWASWSSSAHYTVVFAVTDTDLFRSHKGGLSCFYVPTDAPGYKFESAIKIMGETGGREAIVSFTDVRVPDEWRIGPESQGLSMAFLTLTQTRLWQAAKACGEGTWALNISIQYAKDRVTFGQPISNYQSVQNLLSDTAVELFAGRQVALECARRADRGQSVRTETAVAKLMCVNAGYQAFDRSIQIHGGIGLTNELRLVDGWKSFRISRITEGTDEIMKRTIAMDMLRHGLGWLS